MRPKPAAPRRLGGPAFTKPELKAPNAGGDGPLRPAPPPCARGRARRGCRRRSRGGARGGGRTSPTDRGRRGLGTAARCPRTAPRWCPREGSCRSAAGATGGSACPRPPAVERRRSCPRSGSLPPERADGLDADGEFPPHRARVRTRSGHRPHRGFPPCIARPWPDCALRIGYPGVREASFALTCKRRPMAPRAASIRSSRERRRTSSTRSTCGRRQPRRRASSALPTP